MADKPFDLIRLKSLILLFYYTNLYPQNYRRFLTALNYNEICKWIIFLALRWNCLQGCSPWVRLWTIAYGPTVDSNLKMNFRTMSVNQASANLLGSLSHCTRVRGRARRIFLMRSRKISYKICDSKTNNLDLVTEIAYLYTLPVWFHNQPTYFILIHSQNVGAMIESVEVMQKGCECETESMIPRPNLQKQSA